MFNVMNFDSLTGFYVHAFDLKFRILYTLLVEFEYSL